MGGFPTDDEFSLMQGDPGACANLDHWYQHQYVEGEKHENMLSTKLYKEYEYIITEYTPVLLGTIVGTITTDEGILCQFIVETSGKFVPCPKDSDGFETYFDLNKCSLNPTSGELRLKHNGLWSVENKRKDYNLTLCYEYNCECSPYQNKPTYPPWN